MTLPSSLHDCTAFMTNLPEFLTDAQLQSSLKASMNAVSAPPLQICRSLDTSSLKYGFIIFQTPDHRDAFVAEHDGKELRDPNSSTFTFNVEKYGEKGPKAAKVPTELIDFVLGTDQRGKPRRTHARHNSPPPNPSSSSSPTHQPLDSYRSQTSKNLPGRISRDDVTRLSLGQPSKVRGRGSRGVPHRLNTSEAAEFQRAAVRGYVKVDGTGWRRGRKGSPLLNTHRQYCDSRCAPQVVMMRGRGGDDMDKVTVDLSPLRVVGGEGRKALEDIVNRAAEEAGMVRCEEEGEGDNEEGGDNELMPSSPDYDFSNDPIWKLPTVLAGGVFEGERGQAQAMCKALVLELGVPKEEARRQGKDGENRGGRTGGGPKNRRDAGARGGGRTKVKKNKRRERGGGRSPEDEIRGFF
ncbi:hypothetical protein TrCOL_g4132 [Triparma columacea]|uniref:RRM domain-containing protein n=1 Tax=Triparma columacea TaxID=722753 RepID=A0A9W7GEU6_9STRA|nr:hypothetical protein TrCOL_g4132 [Triparma columacea]